MLRMDPFTVEHPSSADDVVTLLTRHGDKAKLCAGGTDVVPNLKHGLHEPDVLIHLGRVQGLRGIEERDDELVLGAMTTLHDVATHEAVRRWTPSFAQAAAHVAGPQLRRMGTLGGNLCLDTRCLYYNQTYFWREAMGFCLKKDGELCHVVTSGKKCVAAASNDTATALLALDATVEIQSADGTRDVKLAEFYVAEGRHNTILGPGELLVRVRVPKRSAAHRRVEGFAKLRHRESIDYPLLSVGVCFDVDEDDVVTRAAVVVNAIAARPKVVNTKALLGKTLDDALVDELCAIAHKKVTPLTNISDDPAWRKDMVPVYVRRACDAALARD
jgi:4-hydroxybenzoyl-CoA reductase subunit beta